MPWRLCPVSQSCELQSRLPSLRHFALLRLWNLGSTISSWKCQLFVVNFLIHVEGPLSCKKYVDFFVALELNCFSFVWCDCDKAELLGQWGGVVPKLASEEHRKFIDKVCYFDHALQRRSIDDVSEVHGLHVLCSFRSNSLLKEPWPEVHYRPGSGRRPSERRSTRVRPLCSCCYYWARVEPLFTRYVRNNVFICPKHLLIETEIFASKYL